MNGQNDLGGIDWAELQDQSQAGYEAMNAEFEPLDIESSDGCVRHS